jgi:hypothetical protein
LPQEYQLAITVFYVMGGKEKYSSTFFNQTVELRLGTSELDFESVLLMIWGFACLGGIITLSYALLQPDSKLGTMLFAMFTKKATIIKSAKGKEESDSGSDSWTEVKPKGRASKMGKRL